MKNYLLLILLCLPMIGFGQLTYVPDDAFEEYIETTFPVADNGLVNDNYVLTSGLDGNNNSLLAFYGIGLLSLPITDLTGIEDFVNYSFLDINGINISSIDLTQINIGVNLLNITYAAAISISNCPLVTDIVLPSDTITELILDANTYLTNIDFQSASFLGDVRIEECNSLQNIDMSNTVVSLSASELRIVYNQNLSSLNLKNGFCYNWGTVAISNNVNLFCVQVDDPNYSSISANWTWDEFNWQNQNSQYGYSTNCGWPSAIDEYTTNKQLLRTIDVLGRETKGKKNEPLFYIYDDGTVEKRIVIE